MPARAAAPKTQSPVENSSLLNPDRLKNLYSTMLQCRLLTKALPKQPTIGQEAVMVGCGANLKSQDYIVSGHPVAAFASGSPLERVIAQSYVASGNSGASLGAGLGVALVYQKKSRRLITLAYITDGPYQEAVGYAAKNKLPVVFVMSGPVSSKNALPVIEVDASDVVAIYRVSQEAIRRAREGHGPTLIVTNILPGSANDPLEFMERYLRTRRLWSDAWKQQVMKDFHSELDLVTTALDRTARL